MTTAPSPPIPAVQVLERDDAVVVEIDLPGTEPAFTVSAGPRRLVVTVPRERPVHRVWHVNPDVVPD
jgi:HSP20 family molecular chaperone IbpA